MTGMAWYVTVGRLLVELVVVVECVVPLWEPVTFSLNAQEADELLLVKVHLKSWSTVTVPTFAVVAAV